MRLESTDLFDDWKWSLQCTTGCEITGFTYNYAVALDAPPPAPGETDDLVAWQGGFSVLGPPTSDYSIASGATLAGSVGSSVATAFLGNGQDILVG